MESTSANGRCHGTNTSTINKITYSICGGTRRVEKPWFELVVDVVVVRKPKPTWMELERSQEAERSSPDGEAAKGWPDILPDVVFGWMLLQRSGLDASERATILASTQNVLEFDRIEAALRQAWADEDLRRRDDDRGKETRRAMAHAVFFGADA